MDSRTCYPTPCPESINDDVPGMVIYVENTLTSIHPQLPSLVMAIIRNHKDLNGAVGHTYRTPRVYTALHRAAEEYREGAFRGQNH